MKSELYGLLCWISAGFCLGGVIRGFIKKECVELICLNWVFCVPLLYLGWKLWVKRDN